MTVALTGESSLSNSLPYRDPPVSEIYILPRAILALKPVDVHPKTLWFSLEMHLSVSSILKHRFLHRSALAVSSTSTYDTSLSRAKSRNSADLQADLLFQPTQVTASPKGHHKITRKHTLF